MSDLVILVVVVILTVLSSLFFASADHIRFERFESIVEDGRKACASLGSEPESSNLLRGVKCKNGITVQL